MDNKAVYHQISTPLSLFEGDGLGLLGDGLGLWSYKVIIGRLITTP